LYTGWTCGTHVLRNFQTNTWRPIAKDGADLPLAQQELCPAQLTISVGETYDFEFRPERAGELTLEVVRPSNHKFPLTINFRTARECQFIR